MKGFTKIMLIIASVAVGALIVVVASVAWFTSNPVVDANEVSLSSANTLVVAFDSSLYKSNYAYDGQTGLAQSGENAPYVYPYGYFKVNLSNSASEKRSVLKLDFSTVKMECAVEEVQDLLIEQLFQVQIACYQEQNGGAYEMESENDASVNYSVFRNVGAGNGHYALIADDYTLGANNYLYRNNARVELAQGLYYLAFTYTFLPSSGGGYVPDESGTFVGQVSYKQIKGSVTYAPSGSSFVQSDSGEYTRVVTSYVSEENITKYKKNGDNDYSVDASGTYIKIKDAQGNDLVGNNNDNNFAEFARYSYVAGFPYAHIKYQGARYLFSIVCSVEEV